jgi:hypothetical protein
MDGDDHGAVHMQAIGQRADRRDDGLQRDHLQRALHAGEVCDAVTVEVDHRAERLVEVRDAVAHVQRVAQQLHGAHRHRELIAAGGGDLLHALGIFHQQGVAAAIVRLHGDASLSVDGVGPGHLDQHGAGGIAVGVEPAVADGGWKVVPAGQVHGSVRGCATAAAGGHARDQPDRCGTTKHRLPSESIHEHPSPWMSAAERQPVRLRHSARSKVCMAWQPAWEVARTDACGTAPP